MTTRIVYLLEYDRREPGLTYTENPSDDLYELYQLTYSTPRFMVDLYYFLMGAQDDL